MTLTNALVLYLVCTQSLGEVYGDLNTVELPSLDLQQYVHPEVNAKTEHGREKRKIYQFEMHPHKKWSMPIKYIIDGRLRSLSSRGSPAPDLIEKVMREDFEANTCIRFEKVTRAPPTREQYLLFRKSRKDSACIASVGMENKTQIIHGQPIELGLHCFALRKALIYTIASTLGLLNEMNRPDRDLYVDVERENVNVADLFNFARHSEDYFVTHDLPYDFGSIMHARPDRGLRKAVKKKNETALTLVPKDRHLMYVPGQRSELSFYDIYAINKAYCNTTTCRRRVTCENGGYPDPTRCGLCKCPDGYKGMDCSQISGSAACLPSSGVIEVSEQVHCLQSPSFDTGTRRYDAGSECAWKLVAPTQSLIDFWFESLQLDNILMSVYATCLHWIEVKYKGLDQTRGSRYCKIIANQSELEGFVPEAIVPTSPDHSRISETNEMLIVFKSPDYFEAVTTEPRGFKLCYRISDEKPPVDSSAESSTVDESVTTTVTANALALSSDNGDGDDDMSVLLYVGVGIGILLLILVLCVCICMAVMLTSKRRRCKDTTSTATGATDAAFQTASSTVVIHDVTIEEAIAKKKDEIEGIVNPAMHFDPPGYTEQELPPKYDVFDETDTAQGLDETDNTNNESKELVD